MSYDFALFLDETCKQTQTVRQYSFADINELWPDMPDAVLQQLQDRIVEELLEVLPHADVFVMPDSFGTTSDPLKRIVEITSSASSVQVTLFEDFASIRIPYWFSRAPDFRLVLEEISRCVSVIEDITQFVTYDHQLGRVIRLP